MISTTTIIALDLGYGYVKAYAGGTTPPVIFPSVIGIAENIRYAGDIVNGRSTPNGIHLTTPAGERFVGELALSQSRVNWSARDKHRTPGDTLDLALAGISELGITDPAKIKLITGLPVKWYKDKDKLIDILAGKHTIHRAGREPVDIEIIDPLITIQPFGSLFFTIFNLDGKITNPQLARSQVGVIDIGMYTTDIVIASNGLYVEPGSGSTTTAMAKIYELTALAIEETYNRSLSHHQVDQAIQDGFINVRGQKHKLYHLVEPIIQGVASDILATVATKWSDYESGLDTILISGGGASTIGPYLTDRFPHLAILPDSHITNVIGYYRYGLFKSGRKSTARQRTKLKAKATNGRVPA